MDAQRPVSCHFHVAAREMLLEEHSSCPDLPDLALVGLAITDGGQHHVIIEWLSKETIVRAYFGPTQRDAYTRSRLLADGLRQGRAGVSSLHAALVQNWVCATWEATIDELVDAMK